MEATKWKVTARVYSDADEDPAGFDDEDGDDVGQYNVEFIISGGGLESKITIQNINSTSATTWDDLACGADRSIANDTCNGGAAVTIRVDQATFGAYRGGTDGDFDFSISLPAEYCLEAFAVVAAELRKIGH